MTTFDHARRHPNPAPRANTIRPARRSHRGGPKRLRTAARLLVVLAVPVILLVPVFAALTILSTTAASAHTDLLQGSPGPGQQVGGTVDFVDLVFVDPVADAVITIEGPDGAEIDGTTAVADGQIIRYEMPPLTEVGRYVLRYSMISADGDFTTSGFFFVYDPSAIEPIRLGDADIPESGTSVITVVAGAVFGLCMIGLVMVFLTKLERSRAAAAAVGEH